MSYQFRISPLTADTIAGLPAAVVDAFFEVVDRLELDPYAATQPYGEDDGIVRETTFADWGLLVVLVNPESKTITPISITYTG